MCCFNLWMSNYFDTFICGSSSSNFFPSRIICKDAANESCPWRKLGVENKVGGHKKARIPFVLCSRRSLCRRIFLGQSSSFSPLSLPPNARSLYALLDCRGAKQWQGRPWCCARLQDLSAAERSAGDKRNSKLPKQKEIRDVISEIFAHSTRKNSIVSQHSLRQN